jgi:hypothetical protein
MLLKTPFLYNQLYLPVYNRDQELHRALFRRGDGTIAVLVGNLRNHKENAARVGHQKR